MGGNVALRQSGEDTHAERRLYSIGDLASETGVTHRALRLYEDQGLLAPQRIGNQRIYSYRDRARLILVLRGKRLGFSLADIREMLEMYDVDPAHLEQLRVTLKKASTRIAELEQQRVAIAETLAELRSGERMVRDLVRQKEAADGASHRKSVIPPPHPPVAARRAPPSPPQGAERGIRKRSKS
ncbi:MAG TPA: MerR family DNA-binding transcriptional regulator [Xanthobacteraceae bacterium]|jgi:DNA-binding transcriptional MerR regulator|nr:MerR family DNA-binding transcriptional regulator [Xanthobacteraceae bacterium]